MNKFHHPNLQYSCEFHSSDAKEISKCCRKMIMTLLFEVDPFLCSLSFINESRTGSGVGGVRWEIRVAFDTSRDISSSRAFEALQKTSFLKRGSIIVATSGRLTTRLISYAPQLTLDNASACACPRQRLIHLGVGNLRSASSLHAGAGLRCRSPMPCACFGAFLPI